MDVHRITLLRDSFARLAPFAESAAALFYRRLMDIDPSTEALFAKTDMVAQGARLMQALATAVAMVERPAQLLPKLSEMARRHVAHGVRREHYVSFGAALLWSLHEGLGDDFTAEVEDAWAEAYAILADVMMDAAYRARSSEDLTFPVHD